MNKHKSHRQPRSPRSIAMLVLGAAFLASTVAAPAIATPGDATPHVVSQSEIQARIDQRADQVDADRQAIHTMLGREDVRSVAGSAGIDLARANATAATLSGPALESLAAQARAMDVDLAGGDGTIVLTTTGVIIILLILILLVN